MRFVLENLMATSLDKNIVGSHYHGNHGNHSNHGNLGYHGNHGNYGKNYLHHTREVSSSSVSLFEVEDTLKKPLYGILMKAPFFDDKKYDKVCYEVSEVNLTRLSLIV